MDMIATGIYENLITAMMRIDLSAAFNCVCHRILMSKLLYYGLDDNTMQWIDSYMSFRSGYVTVGSAVSTTRSTPHGVPQGSCLGPHLYLLYVNEDDNCRNKVHNDKEKLFPGNCGECGQFPMFADDGQYMISSNDRHRNQEKTEETFWKIEIS